MKKVPNMVKVTRTRRVRLDHLTIKKLEESRELRIEAEKRFKEETAIGIVHEDSTSSDDEVLEAEDQVKHIETENPSSASLDSTPTCVIPTDKSREPPELQIQATATQNLRNEAAITTGDTEEGEIVSSDDEVLEAKNAVDSIKPENYSVVTPDPTPASIDEVPSPPLLSNVEDKTTIHCPDSDVASKPESDEAVEIDKGDIVSSHDEGFEVKDKDQVDCSKSDVTPQSTLTSFGELSLPSVRLDVECKTTLQSPDSNSFGAVSKLEEGDRVSSVDKVVEVKDQVDCIKSENRSLVATDSTPTFVDELPLPPVRLDVADRTTFYCPDSDVVSKPETDDIVGSIFELEQDEVSTPKGSRRAKLQPTPIFKIPHWIKPETLLDEMWEKKRTLRSAKDAESEFAFPSVSFKEFMNAEKWKIPELVELKEKLNKTKSQLDYLPLEAWHLHTKRMNIANLVMSYVKRYFNPEFSSVAWGKFFEILCTYNIVPPEIINRAESQDKVQFNSIHLCEAPGAFISALNHFLKTRYPNIDWNWLASTLNPYHEGNDISKMINDDRLILMSLDHWTFLEDSTGNILNSNNLKYLLKQKEEKLEKPTRERQHTKYEREGVMLVTADGSVDCQSNPGEQEMIVAHLQFGEIIAALSILRVGGSFVLKIFTFLEAPTICHLYLLSCVFKEVHLFKPSTSKEGNSEVYVVCLGFLGKSSIRHVWQSKLVGKLETYEKVLARNKVLLPLSKIPTFFIERIVAAARFFCGYQMKIIERNWNTFGCDSRVYNLMKPFRMEAAEEWLEYCELKPLPSKHRLICDFDEGKGRIIKPYHLDFKSEEGCFADKALRAQVNDVEKLSYLNLELSTYVSLKGCQNHVLFGAFLKVGPVVFEKPYSNIRCSRFCLGSMLSIRQELRKIVKPYEADLMNQGLCELNDVCKGHDSKRVHASMSKSCDVELDNLDIMCFNKLTWDFVTKTDFEQQQEDLTKLFDAVFNHLGKDRSIFLCRYPMLSRLQVGLIFCLASVFEKVIIYGDPGKQVVGILLYKFVGLTRPELKNMMQSISDIFEILTDRDFNLPALQLVPMKMLVDHMPCEFLVKYNIHILKQDLQRSIGVIHSLILSANAMKREAQPELSTSTSPLA